MTQPVTISIVCHNNVHLTRRCIDSLYAHTDNFELIITDNGSRDGTKKYLEELTTRGNVRVYTNSHNIGFSRPNRLAFAGTHNPYFVTLNNDVEFQGRWLALMIKAMLSDSRMAIVGARGSCSGLTRNFHGCQSDEIEYVEASCMLVRRAYIETLPDGLFACYLRFAYGEDSDLSLRVREAGYKIFAVDIPLIHVQGATRRIAAYRDHIDYNQEANHAVLSQRWEPYLRRRNFEYRVLVIRHDATGDVLFVTPILEALKKQWPACEITVQTNHPDVLARNPNVKRATKNTLNPGLFDFVFDLDLAYELRPYMHSVEAYAEVCGVQLMDGWRYQLYPAEIDVQRTELTQKTALIHAGPTTWPGKNWPLDRWEIVAQKLAERGYSVRSVGNKDNHLIPGTSDSRGTTVSALAALCGKCDMFVGVDSFPAHVAEAMDCKTFIICGAVDATMRSMPTTTVISAKVEDAGCALELHRLPPPQVDAPCDGACMQSISVGRVLDAMGLGSAVNVSRSKRCTGISGYTIVRNGIRLAYCFEEAIRSLLPICEEVVVCDSDSSDGTKERLIEMQATEPKLRVINWAWPSPVNRGWEWFVEWINFTRKHLQYDYQLQLDADEVLSERSYSRIREAVSRGECLAFKRHNFWRDAWHLIPNGRTCGHEVVRFGPTDLMMPSDEPHPEGEPEIRQRAVRDDSLEIFHYGFIRPAKAYHEKAKIMGKAWFGKIDPRLIQAEQEGKPWQDVFVHDLPYQLFEKKHPTVALDWLRKVGH